MASCLHHRSEFCTPSAGVSSEGLSWIHTAEVGSATVISPIHVDTCGRYFPDRMSEAQLFEHPAASCISQSFNDANTGGAPDHPSKVSSMRQLPLPPSQIHGSGPGSSQRHLVQDRTDVWNFPSASRSPPNPLRVKQAGAVHRPSLEAIQELRAAVLDEPCSQAFMSGDRRC